MPREKSDTLPYVSFVTFENFIKSQAEADTSPEYIDRSMLPTMSGANATALLKALEYLRLIEGKDGDAGKVSSRFVELIEAKRQGDERWAEALKDLLQNAYASIVGDMDTVPGQTPSKLTTAFQQAGTNPGQMTEKSVRFLIKGLQSAGVAMPAALEKIKSTRQKKRRKSRAAKRNKEGSGRTSAGKADKDGDDKAAQPAAASDAKAPPQGFARQDIPTIDNAYIQYPLELDDDGYELFEAALNFVRAVTQKGGKK